MDGLADQVGRLPVWLPPTDQIRQTDLSAYVDGLRGSAYADVVEVGPVIDEATSADPDVGLRAVAALRLLTEQLERAQVASARQLGWSWQDIADRLSVTKQTVHRKHARFQKEKS